MKSMQSLTKAAKLAIHSNSVIKIIILLVLIKWSMGSQPLPMASYNEVLGDSADIELRVAVEPGRHDCFYQDVKHNHNLDISYQVIEISSRFNWLYTHSSDLTIDFVIKAPNGVEIFREMRRKDGQFVYRASEAGIYAICLDNSFSTMSTKLVNLEVYVYSTDDDNDRWGLDSDFTFPPEVQYSDSVETIRTSINKVRDDLIRVSHEQEIRRAIETRDRNIAESNYDYVNRFSMVSIMVMIGVGLIQIYMIRSLFETKSVIKKFFKGY
ncbi:transmembrane emp24 domain-containing protein 1-like [Oppia nitens]|uniref:transmembrane emp24 domain-containing protein 1-like n=1 Tax=Oppia nitens TaxID=1686743 RepID=UPI0023DCEA86|nr:transmembrane emp24 domain-containing protein 1-like [Oppia nitens]